MFWNVELDYLNALSTPDTSPFSVTLRLSENFPVSMRTLSYFLQTKLLTTIHLSAGRGRLLLRTPDPVPYGVCKCSFVETTDTRSCRTPGHDTFPWLDFLPSLTLLLNIGFHRASATGVACRQGLITPPDTWSSPFGTCICSTWWDQSFSRTCRYFSGLCSSNIPRYFLDFASIKPLWSCADSPFLYPPAGHVVTGDLTCIPDKGVRSLFKKGAEYRLSSRIAFTKCRDIVEDALQIYC